MTIVSSSLSFVQANLIAQFAQRLELGLVMEFGRKILRLPLNYYEARRSGEIVSRLQDIQEINQLVSQVVTNLPSQFFIALISFGVMLFYSWKLSLVVVGLTVLTTIATVVFIPILQQKIRGALVFDNENQGVLVEIFKGALTVKVTTAYSQFWEELQRRFGKVARLVLNVIQIGIINNTSSSLISGVGGIIILWYGSTLVIKNELSIGQLLAFNSMNTNFNNFISSIISFVDEFMRVRTATQRLTEVIDYPSEEEIEDNKPIVTITDQANLSLSNINFYHVGRVGLLEDFSVIIPGATVTALIGKSGCGKSTITKLIAGLYPLQEGSIHYGPYSSVDLDIDSLRRQVVLVPQDSIMFNRSIYDNFSFAHPHIDFSQVVEACGLALADDFIRELPEGYQTILGEFGANLSGGQRQRLAIARALIGRPPVLILDESTSALDPVLEARLMDNLLSQRKGLTTLLISHRPSVIMRSDWIVYLERGRVKEQNYPSALRESSHVSPFLVAA
jgi:ABC-type bacteriocin/lantibiotic exporter with double-glycine peptidase domain